MSGGEIAAILAALGGVVTSVLAYRRSRAADRHRAEEQQLHEERASLESAVQAYRELNDELRAELRRRDTECTEQMEARDRAHAARLVALQERMAEVEAAADHERGVCAEEIQRLAKLVRDLESRLEP